jgi:hypothetical protein
MCRSSRFCGSRLRRDAFAFLSYAQSNSRLAPVGELNASGLENLTKASAGAGTYIFASREANDCLGSNPRGGRQLFYTQTERRSCHSGLYGKHRHRPLD